MFATFNIGGHLHDHDFHALQDTHDHGHHPMKSNITMNHEHEEHHHDHNEIEDEDHVHHPLLSGFDHSGETEIQEDL